MVRFPWVGVETIRSRAVASGVQAGEMGNVWYPWLPPEEGGALSLGLTDGEGCHCRRQVKA